MQRFGGDAASDEIRRKGFRHDARKSSPEKKAGGIFFGERECERAMVGRNKQQVLALLCDGIKVGKGGCGRRGWLEAGLQH